MDEALTGRWAATWARAGEELAAMQRAELRDLTDAQACAAALALLSSPLPEGLPERTTSALVEQQRWFLKLRER